MKPINTDSIVEFCYLIHYHENVRQMQSYDNYDLKIGVGDQFMQCMNIKLRFNHTVSVSDMQVIACYVNNVLNLGCIFYCEP